MREFIRGPERLHARVAWANFVEDALRVAREMIEARVACWSIYGIRYQVNIEPWILAIRSRMATEERLAEEVCADMICSRRDLLDILQIRAATLDVIEQDVRKEGASGDKLQ